MLRTTNFIPIAKMKTVARYPFPKVLLVAACIVLLAITLDGYEGLYYGITGKWNGDAGPLLLPMEATVFYSVYCAVLTTLMAAAGIKAWRRKYETVALLVIGFFWATVLGQIIHYLMLSRYEC